MVSTVASRPKEAASVAARTKLVVALLLAACAGAPELQGLPDLNTCGTTYGMESWDSRGVPARTTVCASLTAASFGDGSSDATGGIQSAINACPTGQVVQLGAGTYRIASGPVRLNKGVVLRGAGPTQTHLRAPDGTNQAVVVDRQAVAWYGASDQPHLQRGEGVLVRSPLRTPPVSRLARSCMIDALTDPSITQWSADCRPGDSCRVVVLPHGPARASDHGDCEREREHGRASPRPSTSASKPPAPLS